MQTHVVLRIWFWHWGLCENMCVLEHTESKDECPILLLLQHTTFQKFD